MTSRNSREEGRGAIPVSHSALVSILIALAVVLSVGLSVALGALAGLVAAHRAHGVREITVPVRLSACIEASRQTGAASTQWQIRIAGDDFVMCSESGVAASRACTRGAISVDHDRALLVERRSLAFDGNPIARSDAGGARYRFEIIYRSSTSVIVYSPLDGLFALNREI